jgi:hypothetical protein
VEGLGGSHAIFSLQELDEGIAKAFWKVVVSFVCKFIDFLKVFLQFCFSSFGSFDVPWISSGFPIFQNRFLL